MRWTLGRWAIPGAESRGWPRTGNVGGLLRMAYASSGQIGLGKAKQKSNCKAGGPRMAVRGSCLHRPYKVMIINPRHAGRSVIETGPSSSSVEPPARFCLSTD